MLYSLYELGHWSVRPMRAAAYLQSFLLRSPLNLMADSEFSKAASAATDLFEAVTRRYVKPQWNLPTTMVNSLSVAVKPEVVWRRPWCSLVHFARDEEALRRARGDRTDPAVLIVAPLSGHYATLLRGTVEAFLPDYDVYITDWQDARMAPIVLGRFDLNDYVDYIIDILRFLGPDTHVVAVCQPGPPVLAAISILSEAEDEAAPATMTFMGSPIDARRSPTQPNQLAQTHDRAWFEKNMIHTVPLNYPGAFRRVYPGFVQLASFMGMNWNKHVDAHYEFYKHLIEGDGDSTQKHREFYDEYLSVLDLSEEFYMQTIVDVFQEYKLARGAFEHHGRIVRPKAIRNTALMTVEGERDDISGIGQTQAAHDLCENIPHHMQLDYVQEGVGHYGVFNGRRFATEIFPRMREFQMSFRTVASRGARQRRRAPAPA